MIQNNLLDIAAFLPRSLHLPSTWVGHLPFAAWVIREVAPKIFVELGTHSGNSYFAFCQSIVEAGISTKCYAVDTWQGDEHAGRYGEEIFTKVNKHNSEHYSEFSKLLRMTFDDAVTCFAGESIDLLHIDGLHTYEAVRHDFESWLPKLAPGAIVMFHDTNIRERKFGVWKLWKELQARYPRNLEFVHSHGLGVLQLSNVSDDKALKWLQPSATKKERLINYFAALGSRQLERFELNELKPHAANLNQVVADSYGQIASLNQTVTERDRQIVGFNQEVVERNAQIISLNQKVQTLTEQVEKMGAVVADRDEQITDLKHLAGVYKEALRTIEEIRKSSSWRITAPMRYVSSKIRNIGGVFKLLPSIIRFGGGVVGSAGKARRVFLREGWGGVKRRILFAGGNRNDYAEWLRRYETMTNAGREQIESKIVNFQSKPLISILIPVYNSKPKWLIEAIESVRKQTYPYWELCIADDASTDERIRPILEGYAREDKRIKVIFREKNGNISAASNTALAQVTGEWVALLDHDDLLAEQALFFVADAINQNQEACLIYSDEDKIDVSGKRFDPYFKCDWNVDLFYSHNMITHLGIYRTGLLKEIGGFREGVEGAQDYDLALRCIERIDPNQIYHIPRVLYHWRAHAKSTAQTEKAKPYAMLAGEKALNEHFQRQRINAMAMLTGYGYRVHYALPDKLPLVSLIIPTRNGLQLIQKCVESILKKTTYPNYEILIIDNDSDDPAVHRYFEDLRSDARVSFTRDERPFNYSALNNAAAKLARGEVLGLLNNDLEVISPEWLSEMVSIALQPKTGAVGARLWYSNKSLQHGGIILGIGGWAGHAHKGFHEGHPGYVGRMSLLSGFSAVTGACLIVRRQLYEQIGGLNESHLQTACGDVDFCLRLREAGYRNIWTPYAELYHYESATRGYENTPEKQKRFAKEVAYMKQHWGDILLRDPAYSPNLTLDHEDFSLAWPPRIGSI